MKPYPGVTWNKTTLLWDAEIKARCKASDKCTSNHKGVLKTLLVGSSKTALGAYELTTLAKAQLEAIPPTPLLTKQQTVAMLKRLMANAPRTTTMEL
jgi:hypothetical protein